jgi:predicted phage baseplate assembly protein
LQVEGPEGWRDWTEVDEFHASTESDFHFVVDPVRGEIRFGDGLRGMAPQIGQRIRVKSYRYGGGEVGNVPAKAISKIPAFAAVKVFNPLRATNGSDAETTAKAIGRIPGELRRRDRAVTVGDFRELALATPGADVGRAECLPRYFPPARTTPAAIGVPGIVTVVVWPRRDAKHPNAPLPDRNVLRTVCKWLDQRRLVTTELYVIPPVYRKVAVAVGLRVKPGFGIEAVRSWVELVLRQYLAPLPPYGPSGEGWPLGRRVHGPELEAAALQVEGVEFLEGLEVAGLVGDAWVSGTVELEVDEVPELMEITVVEGVPTTSAGTPLTPPTPPKTPIPIPVIREEC